MPTETDTLPLIRTKLYRPRVTADLVPRPLLLQHLEERRGMSSNSALGAGVKVSVVRNPWKRRQTTDDTLTGTGGRRTATQDEGRIVKRVRSVH